MISCAECIESIKFIEDPRRRSGKYHMCSCDYCNKPTYYRELEANLDANKEPQVIEHIHRHSDMGKKEFDLLQQTVLKADYLLKELSNKKVTNSKYNKYSEGE